MHLGGGVALRLGPAERRALVVLASVALHMVVLGWLALRRAPGAPAAEVPALDVRIVTLRPARPKAPALAPSGPTDETHSRKPPATVAAEIALPVPRANAPAGPPVDPRWRVDLNKPVFRDGRWPRPPSALERPRCDPWADPDKIPPGCRREMAVGRAVTRNNDPQNGDDDFAREARRKESMRAYRDAPGTSGYPGLRCALFHKC
jgi:hypothetical protein